MAQHSYHNMFSAYPGQQAQQQNTYASAPVQVPGLHYRSPQVSNPASAAATVATPAGNITGANGSYEYSGSRIPGLGMRPDNAGSALHNSSFGVETSSVWQQGMNGKGQSAVPFSTNQEQVMGHASEQRRPHAAAQSSAFAAQHSSPENDDALEEGELSESQFEDLYEPRGPQESIDGRSRQSLKQPSIVPDRSGSAGDADGSSIYDTGSTREEALVHSTSASLPAVEEEEYSPGEYHELVYQARERSGSYSPYLSPREVQQEPTVAKITPRKAKQITTFQESLQSFAEPSTAVRQRPEGAGTNGGPSGRNQTTQLIDDPNLSQPTPFPGLRYKSVSEAKKKAQEAILGLWHLKVRYQDYIEEGFDPSVISTLFTDLGLDTSPPKTTASLPKPPTNSQNTALPASQPNSTATSSQIVPKPSTSSQPAQPQPKMQSAQSAKIPPVGKIEPKMADKTAGEERKDKIARMLAAKQQKSSSIAGPAGSTAPVAPLSTSASKITKSPVSNGQTKDKMRAEANQKLQQKLAALKNAQEEAEAKKKQDLAQQTVVTAASDAANISSREGITVITAQPDQASSPGERGTTSSAVSMPGHRPTSTPQLTAKSRNLKRPVASDFDNYPSNGGTLKRNRTQETLIIDVSDDEDVEMDIGSPTDVPDITIQSNNGSGQTNSLATHPPLSDRNTSTWRQVSSPVSTAFQTPPDHGNKLDFLHKQIEEAKRKIAEAEAKKAAKRSNGASTPLVQTPAESARLPKPSDVANAARSALNERRERIASYQLPEVTAAVRAKQEKLKHLQSEAAQLERELQADLAAREKLTAEMEDFEDSVETESNDTPHKTLPMPPASVEHEASVRIGPRHADDQGPEPRDTNSSGDKSSMDLDSPDSSENEKVNDVVEDVAGEVPNDAHADAPIVNGDGSYHNVSPAPVTSTTRAQAEAEGAGVADTSLHTSAAEPSVHSEDELSEPMPAQISSTDKIQVLGSEDGEIADEDPYEPSPAQAPDAAGRPALEAPTGEVQLRPSREHRLLTINQADPKRTLSAQELLSYQSPLKYFHAYRFHPKFFDDVSGGLKSMTYSSRIDAMRPLCPFNLAGDMCPNGPGCEFQHFESMVLPDTDIIAQIGSTDMYTGEQKTKFVDGLKKVLNDLKTNKVKDFDRITRAIIKYRAEFLGDGSKVLALDGVKV